MNAWYGTDKVAFLKVDGVKIKKLSEMYKVPSYPHFVVVIPNTQGKTYTAFKYTPRNYDTLKKWMLEVMGDTKMISTPQIHIQCKQLNQAEYSFPYKPYYFQQKAYQAETASTPLNPGTAANTVNAQKLQQTGSQQVEIPQVRSYAQQQQQQINTNNYDQGQQKQNYQNNELDQLKEQLNQILNSNADQINQQHEELHSQIKTITQLTQDQASKFEEFIKINQLSPATYVLLGVVGGCISAVVLITYVSKSNQSQKKRKYRRGGPSSGSPLTGGLDEEKLKFEIKSQVDRINGYPYSYDILCLLSIFHSHIQTTLLLHCQTQYAQIAPDWYKNAQMPHIDSREKFYDLFKQPKHVFVEFFSPQCRYCALFLDDFNKLYHHLIDTYGEEQVAVYTLNGWEFQDIVQQVRVPYYPFFVYIAPNNEAPVEGQQKFMISGVFQEDRTYDIMLNWMLTMASGMKPKDQEHNDGAQNIDIIDKKQVPLDTDSQKKLNNIFGDNSNQQDMQVAPPQVYQRDKQVYPFMKSVKDQQVPIETQEKFNQLMSELRTRLHNNTESLNLALQKTLQLPLQHQKLNTDKPVQQILQNPKNLLNQQPPTHPSQFQFVYLITGFVTGMLVTSLLLSILMKQIKLINNKKSGNKKIRVKDSESQISKETLLNNQHVIESSKQLTDTGSCQNNVFEEIPLHNTNY